MPLPANFQTCTVTGKFIDIQGNPVSGSLTFTPQPTALLDQDVTTIIVTKPFTATLDSSGAFSIVLPATDDPDINPVDWTYAVSENFLGGRKYNIYAPQSTTIDLSIVSPVPSSPGSGIVRGPQGAAGGVQYVNGHTGDIVTLTYADVNADQAGAAAAAQAASLQKSHNLNDVANVSTARSNLGLGTAATHASTDFDAAGTATGLVPIGTIMAWSGISSPAGWMMCDGAPLSRTAYPSLLSVITAVYSITVGSTGTTNISLTTAQVQHIFTGMHLECPLFPVGTVVTSFNLSTGSVTVNQASTGNGVTNLTIFPWGNGDGTSTFNVPNLVGRVAVMANPSTEAGPLGASSGTAAHAHALSNNGQALVDWKQAGVNGDGIQGSVVPVAGGTWTPNRKFYATGGNDMYTGVTDTPGNGAVLRGSTDSYSNFQPGMAINYIVRAT